MEGIEMGMSRHLSAHSFLEVHSLPYFRQSIASPNRTECNGSAMSEMSVHKNYLIRTIG